MSRSTVARLGAVLVVFAMLGSTLAVVGSAAEAVVGASPAAAPASGSLAAHPTPSVQYAVTFSESGLPAGLDFEVMLGSSTSSTTTDGSIDSLGFFVSSGSYSYTVDAISGWHQSTLPYSGSVDVNGAGVSEPTLQYTEVNYTVTFAESGLPSGETFGVTFDGSPGAVTTNGGTDSVAFEVPNGTYSYAIAGVSGWHQTTLAYSGHATVHGAALTEPTLAFVQVTYSVSFTESGLPSGQTFAVSVDGTPKSLTTNGGTDSLSWSGLPNGTYPYAVSGIAGWQQSTLPYSGNVVVNGGSVTEPTLLYSKSLYTIIFSESGLPAGQTFEVSLGHGVESLTTDGETDSLLFSEPNGTYSYTIDAISGWHQTTLPYSGSVVVDGASIVEPTVVYFQINYTVEYTETGLPTGTAWSITLNGVLEGTTGTSLNFTDPNGTYAYAVGGVPGYATSPESGSQRVDGANVSVTVPFHQVKYTVTFVESGLPSDTSWRVTIGAQTVSSTGTSLAFQLPNGTFDYSVPPLPGWAPVASSGSVTVNAAPTSVSVPYALVTYTLTFTESGLPTKHPKPWSVSLDDVQKSSTTSTIEFAVGNGTYDYLVRGPNGYRVSSVLPPQGTFTIDGASQSQPVTFLPGGTGHISFREAGLAVGTSWCATLGVTLCSTRATIVSANLTPGTYSYSIKPFGGLTTLVKVFGASVPASGTVALATSAAFGVQFTYAVTFTESGLPSGTAWKVTSGGESVTSTSATIVLYLKNGTYSFRVTKVTGYVASPASGAFKVAGSPLRIAIRFTTAPSH